MSDASSDDLKHEMRATQERKLYLEMVDREKPRRERALGCLLKYLKRKNSLSRTEFIEACAELNDFNPETFLKALGQKSEETWAALLFVSRHTPDRFGEFHALSPFKGNPVDWELAHWKVALIESINFNGKEYSRKVDCKNLFNPPKEFEGKKWEYFRGADPW